MSLMRLLTSGKTLIGLQETRPRYRMTDPRALPKFGSGKNPFRSSPKAEPAQTSESVQIEAQVLIGKEGERENPRQSVREGKSIEALSISTVDVVARVDRGEQRRGFAGTGRARPVTDVEFRGARENGALGSSSAKSATEDKPALSAAEGERGKLPPVRQPKGAFRLSDWAERLGSLLPIRPRPARSALRSTPQQEQGELSLSLDQVTVVRNDLSDSDVEIVAAKRPAKAALSEVLTPDLSRDGTGEAAERAGKKIATETAWGRATMQLFGTGRS